MEGFLLTKNLLVLLIAIPIHGVCALLCARDARYFDLLIVWAKTRMLSYFESMRFWKGASYSPLELDLPNIAGYRRTGESPWSFPRRRRCGHDRPARHGA